jgi:hypothetical protein
MKANSVVILLIIITLWNCTPSKQVIKLQSQIRTLEKELAKQQDENKELSSFRVSLEKQFKDPQIYVKVCQFNETPLDSLRLKNKEILQENQQLKSDYVSSKNNCEADKMNLEKVISELKNKHKTLGKQSKKPSKRL